MPDENKQIITSIEPDRGRRKRFKIFLDGHFAFSLEAVVVGKYRLTPGTELSPPQIAELSQNDEAERAYQAAFSLIQIRKRSKTEVKRRLLRRGFNEDIINIAITRLEAQHLIEDKLFVDFWKENRQRFNPKGKRLLKLELRRAGVTPEIIEEGLQDIDEAEGAFRTGQKKLKIWAGLSSLEFQRKMGSYLRRRGYDWEVVRETIQKLWEERLK